MAEMASVATLNPYRRRLLLGGLALPVLSACGGGDAVREVLPLAIARAARLVLDADGLNALARQPALWPLLAARAASPLDAACATAERIRTAIEQTPLDVGQAPVALTMSFGVAQVHSAEDLQAAIARADKALYQSKNAGRNRVSVA